MRYYNEETVRQIVKDAMEYGMTISQTIPMDIKHYPNIEIKEPHGDLKDINKIIQWLNRKCDNQERVSIGEIIDYISNAPVVVEATE